jgi:hypothetical protein
VVSHSDELADVHHQVTTSRDVTVHDVNAGSSVELRVLQSLRGIELAVRRGRVVEDLGDRADDMFVVVKHLMVVATQSAMTFYEDLIGRVDHHLPHIVVG